MQIQKHLFRIAQRSNKSASSQICCKIIYYITLLVGIFSLCLFLIGELHLKNNQHQLLNCFSNNNFAMKSDQFALIYTDSAASLMKTVEKVKPMSNYSRCSVYKNLNYTNVTDDSELLITGLFSIYKMQKRQREELKFENYTIIFKERTFMKDLLYSVPSLLANELIRLVDNKKLNTIIDSHEIYVKSSSTKFYYSTLIPESQNIYTKITGIIQTLFSYAIASIITSLYIYVTIISSPAVILLILKLTPYGRTEGYFQAFKAFPWIGMHSMILKSSNNPQVRIEYISICWSLILYFFVMYLGYYTVILELTNIFFDLPMEGNVGQALFGYFAVIQFLALIFMRTRPFLKFFPVINSLMIYFYMLYCKFSHFGFKFLAGISMNNLGFALFCWMMLNLEIPAQKTWQGDRQYVPNIKQPRAGLIASFNMNWINGLPDQWTMLMPLIGKQSFSKKQLTFINQQYEELNQYLIQH